MSSSVATTRPTRVTAGQLARIIGASVTGDEERELAGPAALGEAGEAEWSWCSGGRHRHALAATQAGAVICRDEAVPEGVVALRTTAPRLAWIRSLEWAQGDDVVPEGVHPSAWVHEGAHLGAKTTVGPFAVIDQGAVIGAGTTIGPHAVVGKGVQVGANCRIFAHVVLCDGVVVGDRVWIKPGAVVGAPGFGHEPQQGQAPLRVPHLGTVVIGDDVEIGANSCVDRSVVGQTVIGGGTRLDNLVQVAHGVKIGARGLIAAFGGLAGGARLGDDVVMGGRAAVIDGKSVGDGGVLYAGASVIRDVGPGERVAGTPARDHRRWLVEIAALGGLPGLLREWREAKGRGRG